MVTLPSQRQAFHIPDEITYLNCAYLSPMHQDVYDAGFQGLNRKFEPWTYTPAHFFSESDEIRARFASLVHGDAQGVSIVPSVSYGIGTAANNLSCSANQRILVLHEQFPSNVYPWRELAHQVGARLDHVDRPKMGGWTAAIIERISADVAIVALPHCHWTDGYQLDLVQISAKCQQLNIPLVLDVTQSLGVVEIDVNQLKPAFLVAAAYKWLLGPYSLAFMWVAPPYRQGRPLEFNWITREGSESFSQLVNYRDELRPDAQRFDVGERSNFTLLPMASAALDLILDWGQGNIANMLRSFTDEIAERATCGGLVVQDPQFRAPHLLGLRSTDELPSTLASELSSRGIYVSVRGSAIRVAPHIYNEAQDIDRLFGALSELKVVKD